MKKLTFIEISLLDDLWMFQIWVNNRKIEETQENFGYTSPEDAFCAAMERFIKYTPPPPPPADYFDKKIEELKENLAKLGLKK